MLYCFALHFKIYIHDFPIPKEPIICISPELGTFEWWISGLMLDPLFFLISRLNNACSPLVINLQIN